MKFFQQNQIFNRNSLSATAAAAQYCENEGAGIKMTLEWS